MALADDPQKHILHMFKMALHDRAEGCETFADGAVFEGLPLEPGEKVYGVYRSSFYFTPRGFIWLRDGMPNRFDWRHVKSCSKPHEARNGCRITLIDGSKLAIPAQEFMIGHGYRVGQLFYAMIERWRAPVRDKHYVLTIEQFFKLAKTDDAISPNWYPDHPGLGRMRDWLQQLRTLPDVQDVLLLVTDYDGGQPCVQEIIVVSAAEPNDPAIDQLAFSWFGETAAKTAKLVGSLPSGTRAFSGIWD